MNILIKEVYTMVPQLDFRTESAELPPRTKDQSRGWAPVPDPVGPILFGFDRYNVHSAVRKPYC